MNSMQRIYDVMCSMKNSKVYMRSLDPIPFEKSTIILECGEDGRWWRLKVQDDKVLHCTAFITKSDYKETHGMVITDLFEYYKFFSPSHPYHFVIDHRGKHGKDIHYVQLGSDESVFQTSLLYNFDYVKVREIATEMDELVRSEGRRMEVSCTSDFSIDFSELADVLETIDTTEPL